MRKHYVGDGVYVRIEGRNVILTAENGVTATDTILLEPEVLQDLLDILRAEKVLR